MNDFNAFGCYFQNFAAKIVIGKGSYIAPNVGLVTANHVLTDLEQHQPGKDIVLGKNCWIGMNSTVLPGVVLGDHTVVGAGSVVTKSVPSAHGNAHADKRPCAEHRYACGFNNINHFNRIFKSIVGVSPTQYRSANREEAQN